jgi:hypothetical protein
MKKILFLDFDGVLHGDSDAGRLFCRLPYLAEYLARMPDVEIVVSSTWREAYSLASLKKHFPLYLHERIIGVTPVLDSGVDLGGRQNEIEAWLKNAGLSSQNAAWIALDDMASFFRKNCTYLILVDSSRGFGDEEGRKLEAWYQSIRRPG